MTFKFSSLLALGLGISACTAAVREPDAKDAHWAESRWPGTTVSDLQNGQHLFAARCGSCHALPDPAQKSRDEWANVIGEMAPRAHLTAEQRDTVLRYLSTASARTRGESSATATSSDGVGGSVESRKGI